jgi:hypothetical protein
VGQRPGRKNGKPERAAATGGSKPVGQGGNVARPSPGRGGDDDGITDHTVVRPKRKAENYSDPAPKHRKADVDDPADKVAAGRTDGSAKAPSEGWIMTKSGSIHIFETPETITVVFNNATDGETTHVFYAADVTSIVRGTDMCRQMLPFVQVNSDPYRPDYDQGVIIYNTSEAECVELATILGDWHQAWQRRYAEHKAEEREYTRLKNVELRLAIKERQLSLEQKRRDLGAQDVDSLGCDFGAMAAP